MTDARTKAKKVPDAVREILRRSGHEVRNALNAVAVNVEVVRSRAGREGSARELNSFAERASAQVGEANALTNGLLALVNSLLAAQAAGTLKPAGRGAGTGLELRIGGESFPAVMSDIEHLASRIAVGVEQQGERVILRVLPEGQSHSKD